MKPPKFLIKLLVSGAIITLLLQVVDLNTIIEKLISVPSSTILIIFIGYVLGQVLSAYKWWLLGLATFPNKKYKDALSSYFLGMLINIFGLGIVGGDFGRAAIYSGERGKLVEALGTVAADRIHGFLILVLIGFVSILTFGLDSKSHNFDSILLALVGLFIFAWFFAPKLIDTVLKLVPSNNIAPKISTQFQRLFSSFPKDKKVLIKISVISFVFHSFQIILHAIMAKGFGADIPLTYLFCTIPLINIFSSLPISWMGLGIREVGYVFFFSPAFVSKETAIAFGALWLLSNIVSSIVGGMLGYLSRGLEYREFNKLLKTSN